MVKRSPSSVYFALIPLMVILVQLSVLVHDVRQVQLGVLELKRTEAVVDGLGAFRILVQFFSAIPELKICL